MSFFDFSEEIDYPIYFTECTTPVHNELLRNTINDYHSYCSFVTPPTRRINWLIYETKTTNLIGAIGLSSCVLAIKCRDSYIGWNKDARMKNSNKVANNYRFCLIPGVTDLKNVGSMALKLLREEGAKRWKSKYGDDLIGIETYVERIDNEELHRSGAVYKASNWTHVGDSMGTSIKKAPLKLWRAEDSARGRLARKNPEAACEKYGYGKKGYVTTPSKQKMVFFKPLMRDWRKHLLNH
jgi:hypothetical protein